MGKPVRIQLSRRKGYRKPAGAVVVSRPSRFGNPYKLTHYRVVNADGSPMPDKESEKARRELAVRDFEALLSVGDIGYTEDDVRRELRGKDLACWCPLPKRGQPDICHAAVLLEVANR